jgi:hypothetical protein
MQYSEFVKQKMAEMAGSNIKASEKMKKIGEEWRGMKAGFGKSRAQTSNAGFGKSRAQTSNAGFGKSAMPKSRVSKSTMDKVKLPKTDESDMEKMVKLLDGKKTKAEGRKVIKAVKKFQEIPVDKSVKSSEMAELVKDMKKIEEEPKEEYQIGHHMGHHTINHHGFF